MRLNKFLLGGFFMAALAISCSSDDDEPVEIPPRDRGEQEIADQEALEEFLQTHYYNYEEFENPSEGFDYMVRIDTIDAENADKTPLIESELLQTKTVRRHEVDYTLYILKVREGEGERPTFADSTFVSYNRQLLNRSSFGSSFTPVWWDLPGYVIVNQNRLEQRGREVAGIQQALPEFRGATGFEVNPDNTISWNNDFGVGAVFMPSGLGYFSNSNATVPPYNPLIITFQLFGVNEADHDRDGIPSYMEDLNGDQDLYNDDTDGNRLPNHSDPDDDGDVIPTRDEITINEDGSISFPDSDGDGTPDYLDPDN